MNITEARPWMRTRNLDTLLEYESHKSPCGLQNWVNTSRSLFKESAIPLSQDVLAQGRSDLIDESQHYSKDLT